MRRLSSIALLGLTVCLGGCAGPGTRQPSPPTAAASIQARDIRGTFVCTRPGLLLISTFINEGSGFATIDTEFRQADPEPRPEISSDSEEDVVTLTPTISFTWKLTPPNLLTIELTQPDETSTRHFLRVERGTDGKPVLREMESPDGPDLDIVFHFDHDLIVED